MNNFVHFLRFFLLADDQKRWPTNHQLPDQRHAPLPVVAGDALRFLVPQHDVGGLAAESLDLRLIQNGVLSEPVGLLRQQDGALYSEIRLRINAAPGDGDYKQFALVVDRINPDFAPGNLIAGRAVLASSSYETTPASHLTDGDLLSFWSSDNSLNEQHAESVEIELTERSNVQQLRMYPRLAGYCYPVDFDIALSDGGLAYKTVLSVKNADPDASWQFYDFASTVATHLRITGTRLKRGNATDDYYRMQMAEVQLMGSPLSEPPTREVPIVGTFRGTNRLVTLAEYVQQIRDWLESYRYTPILVDTQGNELTIRIYHSDTFQLGHQPVRVGLGQVNELNTNTPTLSAQRAGAVTIGAQDRYQVEISDDIQPGNVFQLGGQTYTADGSEKPADVLLGLGLPDGTLTIAAGSNPGVGVQLGSTVLENLNRPAITLSYQTTSGGQDLYLVTIDPAVQPGNVFQVTADGMTTISRVATDTDTAGSIAAYFNATGGRLAVPVGKSPTGTATAGLRLLNNTNRPEIRLNTKQVIAARTVQRHRVYVGGSIQRGNTYVLGSRRVVAGAGDTVLTIARKLGYGTHPFTVDTTSDLSAYAEPGPRYNADDHLTNAEVVSGSVWRPEVPYVAELTFPLLAQLNPVQLVLTNRLDNGLIAISNVLLPQRDARETTLVAYAETGSAFGYAYAEPGLSQQLRLPVALGTGRARQQETLGRDLNGSVVRGLTRADRERTLTSRALPELFHWALHRALKHRYLWVNGRAHTCEGNIAWSDPIGRRQLIQSSATLIESAFTTSNTDDYQHLYDSSESAGYAVIESITLPPGLPVYLQSDSFVRQQQVGALAKPGFYRLLIRCGYEPLSIGVYADDVLVLTTTLAPNRLNRIEQPLRITAGSRIAIHSQSVVDEIANTRWLTHRTESAYSDEYNPEQFRP